MSLSSQHMTLSPARAFGCAVLFLLLSSALGYLIVHGALKLPHSSIAPVQPRPELIRPVHWHTPALPIAR